MVSLFPMPVSNGIKFWLTHVRYTSMHFDKYHHHANQDLRHSQLHGKLPSPFQSTPPSVTSNILIFYHLYLDLSIVKLAINRTILYVLS